MRYRHLRLITCAVLTALAVLAVWPAGAGAATYPNDPYYVRQWGLRRINAPAAWATTQGAGVTVAVVDTGVNYRHPDLSAQVLKLQYDSINDDGDATDLMGHGTGVAGVIAAATNNKTGIAGVAPKAKIMAVRAYSVTTGGFAGGDVADAVMWAADHGAKVINMSLGSPILPVTPTLMEVAIPYAVAKGALVVVAAGNQHQPYCSSPAFNPASLCVGATDALDRVTSFSNYFLRLDMVAPGQGIFTTGGHYPSDYSSIDGTSFSAPHVAGVGALLMSMGANNIVAGLILRASAKDLGLPGYDNTYGFGRLDAKAAVDMCKKIC